MEHLSAYAKRPQYWRHLAPIVAELEQRGRKVTRLSKQAGARGLVMVGSAADAKLFSNVPVVYVEHGAGQSYIDGENDFGYSGCAGLGNVRLFICPNEDVEWRWRAAYPQAAVRTVGSPVLDWHLQNCDIGRRDSTPIVAITCHWDCGICPETMPALPEYLDAVEYLARDYEVIGHAHPRIARRMAEQWGEMGILFEPDPDAVLQRASVLVADNTSLMYEAAALDLPVVALNSIDYRRDVEHGLRFWSHVPGVQVDYPEHFRKAVERALRDPRVLQVLRRKAAKRAYAALDGHASERAADAIERLLDGDRLLG